MCPDISDYIGGCTERCSGDDECSDGQLCCPIGCGYECLDSVLNCSVSSCYNSS